MSVLAFRTSPAGRAGELALWTSAAALMLTVHVGGAIYLLRQEPVAAANNEPPAAIMIELAPEPEAANVEEDQVATETQDVQEVKSASVEPEPEPLPEPVPEPVVEPEPVEPPPPEEVVEPLPEPEPVEPVEEIDPIEQQVLAALENVEVPLPVMRPSPEPKPEPKKAETKKPEKKVVEKPKQRQPQAQQQMNQAKLQTRQSNRTAATQTSSGSSSPSISPARWQSRVAAHLKRRQRYPSEARSQKQEGTATVRFQFDNSGNVLSVSLARSSGYPTLDAEVVSMVKRASPIPAPPANVAKTLTVPVNFSLR